MEDKFKLQYNYYDYDFVVSELNLLDPDDSPCIALRRIKDDIVIGYSNFGKFVGTTPSDPTHMDRLEAAAKLLSHFLMHMERFGITRLSDISAARMNEYLFIMCSSSEEAVYASEFACNLAAADYLTYIKPEDIMSFTEELS